MVFLALLACNSPQAKPPAPTPATEAVPPQKPVPGPRLKTATAPVVETLETRDGVALKADLHLAEAGAPGVVLLHMIPPHFERSSWPSSFRGELTSRGYNVCVPDRRGAGESKGEPKEAYEGEKGRYDVEACVKRLQAHGLGKLAVLGASNGTTSMIDYADWAASEGLPVPVLLGFLTGGGYTETNTPIAKVAKIPAVFTYSVEEREWSHAQKAVNKDWVFHEYPGGEHGTKMFEAKPTVHADLARAIEAALK